MKKIFLTLLIFTLPSFLIAKKSSQLVFNRTATMVLSNIPLGSKYYKPDSAMVWKIESIISSSVSTNDHIYLKLNNQSEIAFNKYTPMDGPIWISDTDSIRFRTSGSRGGMLVSILEFKVVD